MTEDSGTTLSGKYYKFHIVGKPKMQIEAVPVQVSERKIIQNFCLFVLQKSELQRLFASFLGREKKSSKNDDKLSKNVDKLSLVLKTQKQLT
jgi:hypothetical protein